MGYLVHWNPLCNTWITFPHLSVLIPDFKIIGFLAIGEHEWKNVHFKHNFLLLMFLSWFHEKRAT